MDNLNKHQIILLTLLVAFVVSIATGITVVSLLGQNPQPVSQTINRVVEKTIERVIPADTSAPKETTTVVVKEEDLTVSAIDKNSKSLIRIRGPLADGTDAFISDGVVVSDKGYVVVEKTPLLQTTSYTGILSDGSKVSLEIVSHDDTLGLTLLRAKLAQGQNVSFSAVTWADSSNVKLGQTVISLSAESKNVVNIGNAASLDTKDGKIASITTNNEISNTVSGNMLFNLSGEVVGMHIGSEKQVFMASNIVKSAVEALMPKQ